MDSEDRSTQKDTSSSAVTSPPGHTPGPWMSPLVFNSTYGVPVVARTGKRIANTVDVPELLTDTASKEEAVANARLIAAAPDMLDVLTEAAGLQAANYGDATALHLAMTVWVQKARTVLAKARSLPAI